MEISREDERMLSYQRPCSVILEMLFVEMSLTFRAGQEETGPWCRLESPERIVT